jgi:hypothetical protein
MTCSANTTTEMRCAALVLEPNFDSFNGALHKAVLEYIYDQRLSGSTPNRLEAYGADRNLQKRTGYTQLYKSRLQISLMRKRTLDKVTLKRQNSSDIEGFCRDE